MAEQVLDETQQLLRDQLVRLGKSFDKTAFWWIIGPLFSWMVVPFIIFMNKLMRLLTSLEDVRNTLEYDESLEDATNYLKMYFILLPIMIIIAIMVYMLYPYGSVFPLVILWGQLILFFNSLNRWAMNVARINPALNIREFKNAIGTMRIGAFLSGMGIGFIIMASGSKKAGRHLKAEFERNPENVPQSQNDIKPFVTASDTNSTPNIFSPSIPCPACGKLNSNGNKYCMDCGESLKKE
jgi:uncharacterized membrane protein